MSHVSSNPPITQDFFTDPRGKQITLYEDTWQFHISIGHPDMITRYSDLKNTVENPDHIREGRQPATEELYVKKFTNDTVFVSTRHLNREQITIITTSYSGKDSGSKGSIKWCK